MGLFDKFKRKPIYVTDSKTKTSIPLKQYEKQEYEKARSEIAKQKVRARIDTAKERAYKKAKSRAEMPDRIKAGIKKGVLGASRSFQKGSTVLVSGAIKSMKKPKKKSRKKSYSNPFEMGSNPMLETGRTKRKGKQKDIFDLI